MIAKKMQPLLHNNSAIRKMFEEGKKLAALHGAQNVYDFSLGNPNVAAPARIKEAIQEILEEEDSLLVHGYMSNAGYEDVRTAIADSLNRRFGTQYRFEQLIMTVGAASAINITLKSILDAGDEVVVFAPYFVEYGNYIRNYEGNMVLVPTDRRSFMPDMDAFEKALSPRTKAVLINSPNNPTGAVYTAQVLKDLQRIIRKKEEEYGSIIVSISDEPYRELVYEGTPVPWVPDYIEHSIVIYSYSKSLSLPGERIGWILVPESVPEHERLLSALSIANRCSGSVNAPSLMQRVVGRCVDVQVDVAYYDRNREYLYQHLKRLGFCLPKPRGAFYMFMQTPVEDDLAFCEQCSKERVLFVPGSSFGCKGYVRIAYCVSYEMIERAVPALERIAKYYHLF